MGEKWFEFVKRIKKEGNHESLKDAMREASKRKSEWNKDGATPVKSVSKKTKKTKKVKKGKKSKKSRKTKKTKKSKKSKKSRK